MEQSLNNSALPALETPFYALILRNELAKRMAKNQQYSLRSFARSLEIDAGTLSKIISGKRLPSFKLAKKILLKISLPVQDQELFLISIAEHKMRISISKVLPNQLKRD